MSTEIQHGSCRPDVFLQGYNIRIEESDALLIITMQNNQKSFRLEMLKLQVLDECPLHAWVNQCLKNGTRRILYAIYDNMEDHLLESNTYKSANIQIDEMDELIYLIVGDRMLFMGDIVDHKIWCNYEGKDPRHPCLPRYIQAKYGNYAIFSLV